VWYQYPAPRTLSYSGPFENADSILGGTWGHYKASGFSFYTDIQFGYYLSFALKATDATHALNLVVNQTWGANGHFWVSDVPGGPPRGACIFADNTNAWLWPLAGYQCSIPVNQTVYLNWSANEVANGRIGYGVQ
jgi:hypothetical protein